MRRLGVFGGLAMLGVAAVARAQDRERATGLVPVDHARYAKLPSVKRYRGALTATSVDLSDRFPVPQDQGGQGSCVAWATTYAARSLLLTREMGHPPQSKAEAPSPEYVYSRVSNGTKTCREGIDMTQALQLLTEEGAVTFREYPYGFPACAQQPSAELRTRADRLKIGGFRKIDRKVKDDWTSPLVLDDVKGQVAQSLPVVFAMEANHRFMNWRGDGIYHQDAPEGLWHAMTVVGFDEQKQAFKIMNSWGADWGQGGFGWIDYDTFGRNVGEAYVLLPVGSPPPLPRREPPPDADPQTRIAALLASATCADLRLTMEGGRRVVTGFAGGSPELQQVRGEIGRIDPALQWRAVVHPWPQCEAELTLGTRGDARVRLALRDGEGRLQGNGGDATLRKAAAFSIEVETAADRPFVDVFYIQADGSAKELYRGSPAPDASGRRRVTVGADGPRGLKFEVDEPLGDESLIAVASGAPLFGAEVATHTTEREFLTLLRAKMVGAQGRGQPVSSALLRLKTTA